VISNLGQKPQSFKQSELSKGKGVINIPIYVRKNQEQVLVGADVFINWKGSDPEEIGKALTSLNDPKMMLKMITNRGVKVFPGGISETYCTDHWRCRFIASDAKIIDGKPTYSPIEYSSIIGLLSNLNNQGMEVIKTENLYEFDGKRGFSLGQGE